MPRDLVRITGLPIAVDWSVGVIAALLAWGLAENVLPRMTPGESAATYWLAGVVGAVLLLCSVLAHELAHALVARRAGVEVERLTLWIFGGVASLRSEPRSPAADFRIAAVGPATSAALGFAFGFVGIVLTTLGVGGVVAGVAAWLGVVNLLLAAFNLIPGAPLDGGRVLRAFLWHRWGDRVRAATAATVAGQAVATGLVVLAALSFVVGDTLGAVWLGLIGWFVYSAATAEQRTIVVGTVLAGVPVSAAMDEEVPTVPGDLRVAELVDAVLPSDRHAAYPVVDRDGAVLGLVTLAQLGSVPPERRGVVRVADVCLPLAEVAVARKDEPLIDLLPRLSRENGGWALVLDAGRLAGVVAPVDVARTIEMRKLAAH